jgi:Salmonella virulence plasmid 65kDa B protein
VRNHRWNLGSVQSKAISLLTLALITLSPIQPAFAAFGDGSPTITNPSVFTSSDAPKVDGPSGAFTQRVPLDIPPGRNGLQPDVSLQYNSQNTQDSIVGYGWSLSTPYIQRLNKTGSQNLYNSSAVQYFTSSVEGELALDSTTTPPSSAPTILDTLPISLSSGNNSTNSNSTHGQAVSGSFTYTVPAGGSNKALVVLAYGINFIPWTSSNVVVTQNGVTVPMTEVSTANGNQASMGYGVLPQHCDRFFYDKLHSAKMKAIVSDVYDQSLGYRVMEALRNYSQHFDLPVHALVARSDRERDISKRVAVSVVPQLNIPLLSLGGHFKRTVLAELAQCGKFVDLLPLTREYVDGLRRIHKEFRAMAKKRDRAYESLMGRTMGRYLTGRGGVPEEIIAVAKKSNGIAESIYLFSSALYDLSWKQEKVDQLNKKYLKW